MCTSKPKMPRPVPPPAPPPPPAPITQVEPSPAVRQRPLDSRRRGKAGLRIDRTINSTGSSGSGLNIPG